MKQRAQAGAANVPGTGLEYRDPALSRPLLTQLGCGLLAADAGYRGPRTACGAGHQAEFVSCRDKAISTVLGPVTLRRAWYHCPGCGHGAAPRDDELGIAGKSMSPGLRKMAARAKARTARPVPAR
jgi:hypothetical protein